MTREKRKKVRAAYKRMCETELCCREKYQGREGRGRTGLRGERNLMTSQIVKCWPRADRRRGDWTPKPFQIRYEKNEPKSKGPEYYRSKK